MTCVFDSHFQMNEKKRTLALVLEHITKFDYIEVPASQLLAEIYEILRWTSAGGILPASRTLVSIRFAASVVTLKGSSGGKRVSK